MSQPTQGAQQPGPSSPTPGETFLEALQHRVYASIGLSAEDCQQREWLGQQLVLPERLRQKSLELSACEFDRYRAALFEGLARDEAAPRPTRFERPHQYSILRELKQAVERAVTRLAFDLPDRPVVGTLPTRSLEPLMIRVPGSGDVVIVIDGNLLTYANLLAKAVAQALPPDATENPDLLPPKSPGWERSIDRSGAGRQRFRELVFATLAGNPAAAPPYLPDARYEAAAAELCDFMELFVLARAYARIVEGDHRSAAVRRRAVHGQSFDAIAFTPGQEVKADCMGLALLLAAADDQGASLAWAVWAADVLLASFAILDRARWLRGAAAGRALPTPMPAVHDDRRRLLRDLLRNWEGGGHAVRFAETLQPVLDTLEGGLDLPDTQEDDVRVAVC
jgi:hypothetical protein